MPQTKSEPDFLKIMIGEKHGEDLLGEFYEVAYQFRRKGRKFNEEYLIKMQEETLRRLSGVYNIKAVGNPGEGPIPFNPAKHQAYGHVSPNDMVYVINIGWERNGKLILPALVETSTSRKREG
jgi:molecular chaperone GrpE (heat shock protein)